MVPPKCPGQTRQSTFTRNGDINAGIYAKIPAVTFKAGVRSCQPSSEMTKMTCQCLFSDDDFEHRLLQDFIMLILGRNLSLLETQERLQGLENVTKASSTWRKVQTGCNFHFRANYPFSCLNSEGLSHQEQEQAHFLYTAWEKAAKNNCGPRTHKKRNTAGRWRPASGNYSIGRSRDSPPGAHTAPSRSH